MSTEEVLAAVPEAIREEQGVVLYSGRSAWVRDDRPDIYFLGLNPGGVLEDHPRQHHRAADVLDAEPGRILRLRPRGRGLGRNRHAQHQIRGLFIGLGLDPRNVPASNVVFTRSRQVSDLADFETSAEECWPFHAEMIGRLQPKVVVCMGQKAAGFVTGKEPGPEVIYVRHTAARPRLTVDGWVKLALPIVKRALHRANLDAPGAAGSASLEP